MITLSISEYKTRYVNEKSIRGKHIWLMTWTVFSKRCPYNWGLFLKQYFSLFVTIACHQAIRLPHKIKLYKHWTYLSCFVFVIAERIVKLNICRHIILDNISHSEHFQCFNKKCKKNPLKGFTIFLKLFFLNLNYASSALLYVIIFT